jgi:hypothetical protein
MSMVFAGMQSLVGSEADMHPGLASINSITWRRSQRNSSATP